MDIRAIMRFRCVDDGDGATDVLGLDELTSELLTAGLLDAESGS